jgi:hypothetical protein
MTEKELQSYARDYPGRKNFGNDLVNLIPGDYGTLFSINGRFATSKECADLITRHELQIARQLDNTH